MQSRSRQPLFLRSRAPSRPARDREGSRRAFTLVELLVLLALIGLLVAMLLPALAGAKLKAQQLNCATHLKQLSLAALAYEHDTGRSPEYRASGGLWLMTLIDYQTRVDNLRFCPAAPRTAGAGAAAGNAGTPWTWSGGVEGSYAMNGWMYSWDDRDPEGFHPRSARPLQENFFQKTSAVPKPALTPFFMDASWPDLWPTLSEVPPLDLFAGDLNTSLGRCCLTRHPLLRARATRDSPLPGGIVASYVDGHADRLPLRRIKAVWWHKNYRPVANPWETRAPQ